MRIIVVLAAALLAACAAQQNDTLSSRPPGIGVARTAMANGAPVVALQICSELTQRVPGNLDAAVCEGDALTALGRRDEAEASFLRAQRISPEATAVLMGLGRLRLGTDPLVAEALFQRVLDQDPNNAAAWNDIGIARDLQGRHAQAQQAYARTMAIAPEMRAAEVNLALSMAISGHAEEAVQRLRRIAADPAASPRLRHDLAAALAMADRPDEAARLLRGDMRPEEVDQAIAGYRALPSGSAPAPAVVVVPMPPPARPAAVAPPPPVAVALPPPPPPVNAAVAAPPGTPVAVAAAAAGAGITLRTTADVWVRVSDRQGKPLLNRFMHAGDTWTVPPDSQPGQLLLSTGNAGATEVLVDGQAVPALGKSGAVRHDVPLDPDALREGRTVPPHAARRSVPPPP